MRTSYLAVGVFSASAFLAHSAPAAEIFRFDFSNGTLAPSFVNPAAQAAGLGVHDLTVTGASSFGVQTWFKSGFTPPMVWCSDWSSQAAYRVQIDVPIGFELVVSNAYAKVGHSIGSTTATFLLSLDGLQLAFVTVGNTNFGLLAWIEGPNELSPVNPTTIDAPLHLEGGQSYFLEITSETTVNWSNIDDIYLFGELVHAPEPASVVLFLAAGAGGLALRRRV